MRSDTEQLTLVLFVAATGLSLDCLSPCKVTSCVSSLSFSSSSPFDPSFDPSFDVSFCVSYSQSWMALPNAHQKKVSLSRKIDLQTGLDCLTSLSPWTLERVRLKVDDQDHRRLLYHLEWMQSHLTYNNTIEGLYSIQYHQVVLVEFVVASYIFFSNIKLCATH